MHICMSELVPTDRAAAVVDYFEIILIKIKRMLFARKGQVLSGCCGPGAIPGITKITIIIVIGGDGVARY